MDDEMLGNKVSCAGPQGAPLSRGAVQHAQVTWQRLVDTAAECSVSPFGCCWPMPGLAASKRRVVRQR